MSSYHTRSARLLLTATTLLAVGGCMSKTPSDWGSLFEKTAAEKNRPQGAAKVEVGAINNLGNGQEVSLDPTALSVRVVELLDADKAATAAALIRRNPESTLELLRSPGDKIAGAALSAAAEAHDRQTLRNGASGWVDQQAARAAKPAIFEAYSVQRKLFQQRMTEGLIDRALEVDLVRTAEATESPMTSIDALQLRGTALLLAERPNDAVVAFDQALQLAGTTAPYQSTQLLLLRSDALRRAGDAQTAAQTWLQAVSLAGDMVVADPEVLDPVLWERLSYLRPVNVAWPEETMHALLEHDLLPGIEAIDPKSADTILWHSVGRWYLDRGHAQAALVSFKRAETTADESETHHWLRFRQAKALTQIGQSGPATAILVSLMADKKSGLERPASAMLGSIYLQRSQTTRGLTLLKKAVDVEDALQWPERSEAEADLAIAYLTVGDAMTGLDRMHRAQKRFEMENDTESLLASLDNELKFLEHMKKRQEASAVRVRMRALQQAK